MLRAAWRNLIHHGMRLALSGLAIILGVAFVVGTLIFTDTLNATFTNLFADSTSDVIVTPADAIDDSIQIGTVATLPATVLEQVRNIDGVASAAGGIGAMGISVVGADGAVLGGRGAPQLGVNWVDGAAGVTLVSGRGPQSADEVVLDAASAQKGDYGLGDVVSMVGAQGPFSAHLVGTLRYGSTGNLAGATIAAFDTATAQRLLLGGAQAFTQVDVVADRGVSQQELAADVSKALGPQVTVKTGAQAADDAKAQIVAGLSFINVFLLVFAGIALFVGTFIILNTFAMLVAQRSREFALLRALGATRGQVLRSVVAESALVGLVGSLLGIAAGIGVAYGLQALFAAVGAEIPTDGLVVSARTVLVGLLVGVAATVLAALAPALRASRIAPMAALRDDGPLQRSSSRFRAIIGAALAAAGAAAMVAGTVADGSGVPLVGFGALALLVGVIVVSPAIARPLVGMLGVGFARTLGTVGRLAVQNAQRQPRRTAATSSALTIGLALVCALTIFAMSAKASIAAVIDQVIGAQFVVSNTAPRTPIAANVAASLRTVPEVEVASPVAVIPAQIDGATTPVVAVDPSTFVQVVTLSVPSGSLADLGTDGVAVDQMTADAGHLTLGDRVHVTFATGPVDLEVAAIYDRAGEFTGYVVSRDTVQAAGLEPADRLVYIKAAPDADLAAMDSALRAKVAGNPTVQVQSQAQFAEEISANVDQVLLVLVMLLSLAVVIAILGIVNTLVLSVAERTREIGMLRAVGALRGQIRAMIVLEAIVIGLFGAVVGLVLGVSFAVALQRTLVDEGITVLAIPWVGLVGFLVLAAFVSALAAAWPAFRAGRLNVLAAIATE